MDVDDDDDNDDGDDDRWNGWKIDRQINYTFNTYNY